MQKNGLKVIIIPVYKEEPKAIELTSLRRCLTVLKDHKIVFIGPDDLNTSVYEFECKHHIEFQFVGFNNQYFRDIAGYNQLMLSAV